MNQNTGASARNNILALTAGLGLGAGLMYLYDPDRGRRRRRQLLDHASGLLHHDANTLEKQGKHLLNRVRGFAAQAAADLTAEKPVDDETLAARVRSRMGHLIPDPHEVEVSVTNGIVILHGKLAHAERRKLKEHVREIPGVKSIHDRLEPRSVFSPGLLLGLAAGLAMFRKSAAPVVETGPDTGC